MQKIYSPEELDSFSKETFMAVILSMQDQLSLLNTNMERLIEQTASANNHRYGRSSEKLDVIAGQLELELIFNEAKTLTETLYQATKDTVAYEAIKRISAIYHLDNQLTDLKLDDRKKQRQIDLKPLVEALFVWAKEIQISGRLAKGKTLEGINYCVNQEEALKVFLDDGEVPLDNNATEEALRSF